MTSKNKPRYNGAYPLAAEMVLAQRLGDQASQFAGWVQAACLKCYRAIAASGGMLNPNVDASDGKDISINAITAGALSPKTAKKIESYLKRKAGGNWSRMTQAQQKAMVKNLLMAVRPTDYAEDSQLQKVIASLIGYGEFGAVPAFIISDVSQSLLTSLAEGFGSEESAYTSGARQILARNAAGIQAEITGAQFGLTDSYWQNYYQRFKVDGEKLVDLRTGAAVTAETTGAVAADVTALSQSLVDASVIPSMPALNSARTDIYNAAADDFQIIIRAAENRTLAPGVKLPVGEMGGLISIDKFENNPELLKLSEAWVESSMGRIQDISADALQRGIKIIQEGVREGRGLGWVAENLSKQMEIPIRRARNIARNEIGNHAWDVSYANAKDAGMRIYRWHGMLDERERHSHVERENKAFNPASPPPDGNPGQPPLCRCWPEWLFDEDDVAEAENEISKRYRN
ncbi:phage head morphogenesis protein [Serratia marcescens]|nr:phage head morphogenesis protein [Serratia marcescens]